MVREAQAKDRKEIWDWWNDPVTRLMMKQNAYVPWEDHCVWYANLLVDPNRVLCVGEFNGTKIGVVRFDYREDGIYEVSINLNPECRGNGYAPLMLKSCSEYFMSLYQPRKLYATLKSENIPSKKSFARAGFTYITAPTDLPYMGQFSCESELYCELIMQA